MKICHFCSSHVDSPYFSYLGTRLGKIGTNQLFVTLNAPETPRWIEKSGAANYHSLGIHSKRFYPLAIWRLWRILSAYGIDLLQTHLFDAAVIGLLAARLARTRAKIVSRHHLDDGELSGTRFHVAIDKWTNRNADIVVVPSEATRRYMIDVERQAASNVRVVPYGFDFDKLGANDEDRKRVRMEFGLQDSFVIGCVGRFVQNKGHRYLFEAVREVVKEFPEVRILLLGSGDRQLLDERIAEFGIGDKVIFAGYRNDVPACMRAMDLLAHPSVSESFGQVIVEAMCVGTPVVVTSVGGVPEIVNNGETGVVVEPENATALRDALLKMLKEPERCARYAKAGKARVREKFNVERFIDRQWQCYQELLGKE